MPVRASKSNSPRRSMTIQPPAGLWPIHRSGSRRKRLASWRSARRGAARKRVNNAVSQPKKPPEEPEDYNGEHGNTRICVPKHPIKPPGHIRRNEQYHGEPMEKTGGHIPNYDEFHCPAPCRRVARMVADGQFERMIHVRFLARRRRKAFFSKLIASAFTAISCKNAFAVRGRTDACHVTRHAT